MGVGAEGDSYGPDTIIVLLSGLGAEVQKEGSVATKSSRMQKAGHHHVQQWHADLAQLNDNLGCLEAPENTPTTIALAVSDLTRIY